MSCSRGNAICMFVQVNLIKNTSYSIDICILTSRESHMEHTTAFHINLCECLLSHTLYHHPSISTSFLLHRPLRVALAYVTLLIPLLCDYHTCRGRLNPEEDRACPWMRSYVGFWFDWDKRYECGQCLLDVIG